MATSPESLRTTYCSHSLQALVTASRCGVFFFLYSSQTQPKLCARHPFGLAFINDHVVTTLLILHVRAISGGKVPLWLRGVEKRIFDA